MKSSIIILLCAISFTLSAQSVGDFGSNATGVWSDLNNWRQYDGSGFNTVPSSIPGSTNNVWIGTGHTVTIDLTDAACKNLNYVGTSGTLTFRNNGTSASLTINGDLNIAAGCSFKCTNLSPTGAFVMHTLTLYGNLTNSGVLDFRVGSNGSTANGVELTLAGTTNSIINLSLTTYASTVEEFNGITINKTNGARVILNSGNLFMSNNTTTGPCILNFTSGKIETGNNIWVQLSTSSAGVVNAGSDKYVIGAFGRGMSTSSNTRRLFEVGDENGYRPVYVKAAGTLASQNYVAVRTYTGDANTGSSVFNGGIVRVSKIRYIALTCNITLAVDTISLTYGLNDGVDTGNTALRVAYSNDNRATWNGFTQTLPHTTSLTSPPTRIDPDGFSPATTISSTPIFFALASTDIGLNPLPVELISFNYSRNSNSIILRWSTASELNNSGFTIERRSKSDWENIGFIAGAGTSNNINKYSYIDNNIGNTGKYYYRLKQVDHNGNYKYSDALEVNYSVMDYALQQNYPNPFNPNTSINYSLPIAGNVLLEVFNSIGERISVLVNEFKEAGNYTCSFDASKFNSGIYFYKIKTNNYSSVKKMIYLK